MIFLSMKAHLLNTQYSLISRKQKDGDNLENIMMTLGDTVKVYHNLHIKYPSKKKKVWHLTHCKPLGTINIHLRRAQKSAFHSYPVYYKLSAYTKRVTCPIQSQTFTETSLSITAKSQGSVSTITELEWWFHLRYRGNKATTGSAGIYKSLVCPCLSARWFFSFWVQYIMWAW